MALPHGIAWVGGSAASVGPSAVPHSFTYSSAGATSLVVTGAWATSNASAVTVSNVTDSASNVWTIVHSAQLHDSATSTWFTPFTAWCTTAAAVTSVSLPIPTGIIASSVVLNEWEGLTKIIDLGGSGNPAMYATTPPGL